MGDARMYVLLVRTHHANLTLSGRGIYKGNWEIREFYTSKDEARKAYGEHLKQAPPADARYCEYKVISVDTHEWHPDEL